MNNSRVLLDQLLQYEPMSGEEEEVTDYSTSEDESGNIRMHRPAHPKQVSGVECNIEILVEGNEQLF